MDTSRRIQNGWNRIYNSTVGWMKRTPVPYQYASDLPLNPSKLVDDLLYIHGHQVLVDGRFNADCHPGTFHIYIGDEMCCVRVWKRNGLTE